MSRFLPASALFAALLFAPAAFGPTPAAAEDADLLRMPASAQRLATSQPRPRPVARPALRAGPRLARSAPRPASRVAAPATRRAALAPAARPPRAAGLDMRPTGAIAKGADAPNPYGWLVTVNAKGVISPKFTGSGSYGFIGFPTLSFRRPGAPVVWSSPDDSISFRAIETERYALGPVVAYRGGRYAADAPTLRGLHKPRWTLEGGVFADVWLVPELLRGRVELRRGFRDADGFVAILGADWVTRLGALTIAVGPRARLGDGRFMRNQFGVTALDNARNPRFAPHRPQGGLYAVGAYASANYRINDQWSTTLHGGYDRLTAGAAKSPIVRQEGSRNQWMLGAIVSYTFGW